MISPSVEGSRPPLVLVCGPTAGGKTRLAVELARNFPFEVVSADSRQVYRGMDIGTAKATAAERDAVRHHLIDVADPDRPFTANDFRQLGQAAVRDILSRGRRPLVVGGTGLYLRALTTGLVPAPGPDPRVRARIQRLASRRGNDAPYRLLRRVDPDLAARLHPRDRVRIERGLEVYYQAGRPLSELQREHGFGESPYRLLKIGLAPARAVLYQRIDSRVEEMLRQGLVVEVEKLLEGGCSPDLKAMRTIGYREVIRHLHGELSHEEMVTQIKLQTRRYAKRQLTWFRQDTEIIWFETWEESARICELIEKFYADQGADNG